MSKSWGGLGGAGAWALDAERAEEEEREAAAAPAAPAAGFPSLREAAAGAGAGGGKSKKKNKGTTLSLSEFAGYGPGRRAAPAEPKGLTPQEMVVLPTGPRERSADELDQSRHGGGFRSYGGGDRRGGGGGGFDDDGRRGPPSRGSDLDMPSRADEDRDWSMNKKSFSPSPADSGPRNRYGALGAGGGAPASVGRADDDEDWSRGKKPMPSAPSRYPSLGSGGGFRDSPGSADSDRWSRAAPSNGERERPRIVLHPPKRDSSTTTTAPAEAGHSRPSPFGAARPREDVPTEKGPDWRKMTTDIDQKKTSRPTSSQASRPGSAHSSRPGSPGSQSSAAGSEGAPKARPKVNPFGDAKPREVVLQEKGKDWRKIDLELEHRRIDRPETTEERVLKEEINLLKVELNESEVKMSDDDAKSLSEKIAQMERQLELLTVDLDDRIRFAQRPGSGAGRVTASPPSNFVNGSQVTDVESMERTHSRSGTEQYPKPTEERWGFHASRGTGSFGGNRSSDRPSAGSRW